MGLSKDICILIVDDFPSMRKLLHATLHECGFLNVLDAKNGLEATLVLENEDVDLIISDWHMPEMDGLELLKWVRDHEKFFDLPFLMVTADGDRENVVTAIKHGVNNYVMKPFTPAIMEDKIVTIFRELDSI